MEEFLKEFTDICKKHNIFLVGCGKEDERALVVNEEEGYTWIELNTDTKEYYVSD